MGAALRENDFWQLSVKSNGGKRVLQTNCLAERQSDMASSLDLHALCDREDPQRPNELRFPCRVQQTFCHYPISAVSNAGVIQHGNA
jgi:hypothetical protein